MVIQDYKAGLNTSSTSIQALQKIRSAGEEAHFQDDDLFDCCWCGNQDDVLPIQSKRAPLPSTELMADVFWKILDAPTKPNDPLHFAVEALIPLQQVTQWALKGEVVHEDDMTVFLSDVEKVRGMGIILLFLSQHIKDEAAVMCSIRALHALVVDADSDWDGKKATPLTRARSQLIKDFLRENGMEITTRAFGIHALTTIPTGGTELFSQTELRTKTMDLLFVALPYSAPDSAASNLRFICSQTPKMISLLKEKDKFGNKMLMQKTILCIVQAVQVQGIGKKLNSEDRADVVNVSSLIMKASPRDEKIATNARDLWFWAANA
jgi:hypothetical protein